MRYAVGISFAICLLFFAPDNADADVFVKLSGQVQNYEDVTPLEDLADTVAFVAQVGTKLTNVTSVSVVVQQINPDDVLAGVQVDYAVPLNLIPAISPYVGFAASLNFEETADHGVILSGVAGFGLTFTKTVGGFIEARSLTWYTGEGDSTVGVGAGISLTF